MKELVRVKATVRKKMSSTQDIESLKASERRLLEQAGWVILDIRVAPEEADVEQDER